MILLWWGPPAAAPIPHPGGPPPKKKRRQYAYDVYRATGRTVLRSDPGAPAPRGAVRVVVEGQPTEARARKRAKQIGRIKWDDSIEEHVIVAVLLEIGELDV